MNILALNAGGSSLKFCVYAMDTRRPLNEKDHVLAIGEIERLNAPEVHLKLTVDGKQQQIPIPTKDLSDAVDRALHALVQAAGESGHELHIDAAGIRVVHGGPDFVRPAYVDDSLIETLRTLIPLAPLHLPGDVAALESLRRVLPGVPCVAAFDTAFHHDLPPVAAQYALPRELSQRHHLRRYGFHGISYQYVLERALLAMNREAVGTRLIMCHLGGGASVCAVRDGKSVDTSMGFTPLEGLIMGTRVGDIDAGLVLYLLRTLGYTADSADTLLNKESGLLGLSGGISSDTRDLEQAAAANPAAREALEAFAYRVCKTIGAYTAALGGADALIFTDKIGAHAPLTRARICRSLDFFGFGLDEDRNQDVTNGEPLAIGTGDGKRVWVVPNDEERQIARETFTLLTGAGTAP